MMIGLSQPFARYTHTCHGRRIQHLLSKFRQLYAQTTMYIIIHYNIQFRQTVCWFSVQITTVYRLKGAEFCTFIELLKDGANCVSLMSGQFKNIFEEWESLKFN